MSVKFFSDWKPYFELCGFFFSKNSKWVWPIFHFYRLAPNIWDSVKIYVFDGLNDALLRIINEEMTECDIISIIVGDCENAKNEIKNITDKSTEKDVMDATSDNPFDIELKVRFSQMAISNVYWGLMGP